MKRYCENCGSKGAIADFRNFGVIWGLCDECANKVPAVEIKANFDFKTGKSKNPAAVALGRLGGSKTSEAKTKAARENGKKPKKKRSQMMKAVRAHSRKKIK